ncbi:DUF721 domain-containing protein [secondary endosymbiont of Ctenarytaina eucalypti]|uniref:DUF721 domain-containing protein n=1 Tax=secondary endosymbiont of Ctenarytaina eucalypti TaxID=1199245 RepID=J3TX85_9ENTR|nr:DciA family protein [secondary endosymbiont of Ctenarytaina eucalypti]AFP84745.1 hypothetical protein A359_03500 [secondary endosymbiont of Ctenarytaina eucalypti]
MRDSRPHLIDSLFSNPIETSQESLSKIQHQAIALVQLNHAVNMLLPEILRPWCRVANFRQGLMVLETANASWQMRLRYEEAKLLSTVRIQILPSLSSIDIRINPVLAKKQALHTQDDDSDRHCLCLLGGQSRHLSLRSAASIRHVAAQSEGKLKNVLERLAKLAEDSPEHMPSPKIEASPDL